MKVKDWLNSDLGIDIWEKKYRNEGESFDSWINRISNGNEDLKKIIIEKKFLFGGRILSNRGLNKLGKKITLSNCYVLEKPDDSIESIFECASKLARTFSYGGGVGIDLSNLSPRGAKVNNTAKETSGAVSFMELYSTVTGLIGQNGRRGALMISLDCNHPDLEEFIEIKSDLQKITKANISIRITDSFLEAVKNNSDYDLEFVRTETGEKISKTINARKIFNKFAKMNWDYAEPALLYWDRIEKWNLLSNTEGFGYSGVNPCAEEPLPAGGSCLLGSINLSEFVNADGIFNIDDFKNVVKTSVIALNEVLEEGLSLHPLQEQKDSVYNWKQIGLGIFGLADMLIKMKLAYGSDESLKFCDKISKIMINEAVLSSAMVAKNVGSYPMFDYNSVSSTDFYKENITKEVDDIVKKYGIRNSQILTIAPTGTLSTMLGVSGGIEPIFEISYNRRTESLHGKDVSYKVYTPIVKEYMEKNNISDEKDLPEYFITSKTLNYINRIDMQSVWQNRIDASISSTVNVPSDFTVEEVEKLYLYAHEKGLKGVTIFRDGCKRLGILTTEPSVDENKDEDVIKRGHIIDVNDDVIGLKRKITTGCGSLHCTAFFDKNNGNLLETYLSKGSTGGCNSFMIGLSRMISLASRGGVGINDIVDQLNSTGSCPSYAVRSATKKDTSKGACCPMAIGNALKDMSVDVRCQLGIIPTKQEKPPQKTSVKNPCPVCGAELQFTGGCNFCVECSYSKCD